MQWGLDVSCQGSCPRSEAHAIRHAPWGSALSRLSGQSQNLSCGWGILTLLFLLPVPQGIMFLGAHFISEPKCL